MSATLSTTSATSQAIAEWVRIFPRQVTETYTSSVTFMKQLTVVAVSTITYLRNVFPEESYTVESFGGVQLKILRKKCRDELAQFVSTAMTRAFEAFDKKYLHKLALCFYDGEHHADNLMEYYIFEFAYNSAGVTLELHSRRRDADGAQRSSRYAFDNVRERTLHLIRTCVVIMQTCQYELPSSYDVSLQLYYNDEAPEGYQAPGFEAAAAAEDHLAPTAADAVRLGWVETPFHRLVARSYIRDNMGSSHDANASQNPPVMTQNEGEDVYSGGRSTTTESSAPPRLRCPCNKHCGDDGAVLTCDYCGTTQHAACFGVRRAAAAGEAARAGAARRRHCCTRCSDADAARTPTDATLAALPVKKRESLCIFRRTLEWCAAGAEGEMGEAGEVGAAGLAARFGLSPLNAAKLMKLLQSHGILEEGDADLISPRKIIPEQVNNVISKFFQAEESNIVDRLVAETLSQGSPQDPVGDVLSPMEKVSLQHATVMGTIIEHTPPNVVEDLTLKQYRDAIQSSDHHMEELPLSGSHNPVQNMEKIGKTTKRKMDDQENRSLRSEGKTKKLKSRV